MERTKLVYNGTETHLKTQPSIAKFILDTDDPLTENIYPAIYGVMHNQLREGILDTESNVFPIDHTALFMARNICQYLINPDYNYILLLNLKLMQKESLD